MKFPIILAIAPVLLSWSCKTTNSKSEAKVHRPDEIASYENSPFFDNHIAKSTVLLRFSDNRFCSGVIIGQNVIATAAHCFKAHHGRDGVVELNGRQVAISSFLRHDNYESEGEKVTPFDIAIARTATPLSQIGGVPVPLVSASSPVPVGTRIYHAGYGRGNGARSGPDNNAGLLQWKEMKHSIGQLGTAEIESLDPSVPGGIPCSGDSGGPSYIWVNNKLALFGLLSGGPECTKGTTKTITSIQFFLPWIAEKAGETLQYVNGVITMEQYLKTVPAATKRVCGNVRVKELAPVGNEKLNLSGHIFVDKPIKNPVLSTQTGPHPYYLALSFSMEHVGWLRQQAKKGPSDVCVSYADADDYWGVCPDCDNILNTPENSILRNWQPEGQGFEFAAQEQTLIVPQNLRKVGYQEEEVKPNNNTPTATRPTPASKPSKAPSPLSRGMCMYSETDDCSLCDPGSTCTDAPQDGESVQAYVCWRKGRAASNGNCW